MGTAVSRTLGGNECFSTKQSGNSVLFGTIGGWILSDTHDCDCHVRGKCPVGEPAMPPSWEFYNDPSTNYTGAPPAPIPKAKTHDQVQAGYGFPGEGIYERIERRSVEVNKSSPDPNAIMIEMTEPEPKEKPQPREKFDPKTLFEPQTDRTGTWYYFPSTESVEAFLALDYTLSRDILNRWTEISPLIDSDGEFLRWLEIESHNKKHAEAKKVLRAGVKLDPKWVEEGKRVKAANDAAWHKETKRLRLKAAKKAQANREWAERKDREAEREYRAMNDHIAIHNEEYYKRKQLEKKVKAEVNRKLRAHEDVEAKVLAAEAVRLMELDHLKRLKEEKIREGKMEEKKKMREAKMKEVKEAKMKEEMRYRENNRELNRELNREGNREGLRHKEGKFGRGYEA